MNLIDILFIPINKIKKTIGKTDDIGGSSSAGTVMGKLNNIISNNSSTTIGNTTDTGGSATAGTVMGKLNNIISSNGLKSVQRGMFVPSSTNTTTNISITTINTQKCDFVFVPIRFGSSGTMVDSVVLNSSYIAVTTTSSFNQCSFYWQVVEYK